ncbi:hypothetical protein BVIR_2003 [Blastochloris viridis]|uniref:Uncharacterized protein n=1 Tax=Blastochloris viridis TaxID=1079 RepID=A0A0P0JKK5_BLAVI|nr:hypothetical protein BVIR_2003 [Blastochloris viridis]CUU42436.1 hypothetical protein BVIRIDIS_14480 [Blastochloris viridis]
MTPACRTAPAQPVAAAPMPAQADGLTNLYQRGAEGE